MGYRDYSTAKGHIVDTTGHGDFTTIAAAITAASSGQTIFIRPGTYTENLTLKAGVNLCAYDCDAQNNVIISGKCTFTAAGTVSISGIQLKTNSDFFLAVTGSAASVVVLTNCYLNASNNTGISHTSSNASSSIECFNCIGAIGTTGITCFVSTSSGGIVLSACYMGNNGGSTTPSSVSTGSLGAYHCVIGFALSTSSTGSVTIDDGAITLAGMNTTCLTTAGTGISGIANATIQSGTASAVSAGAGTTVNLYSCSIVSSNTNAITGAGTINYSMLSYNGTSGINNVTTPNINPGSAFQILAKQVFTSSGTYTPTSGMKYCVMECVGGGGGGGGTASSSATFYSNGGGGGGGGYARTTSTAASVGSSQTVTVGAAGLAGTAGNNAGGNGGDTSVGSLCVGKGATGGGGGNTGATNGGAGGVAGTGDLTFAGQSGDIGITVLASGTVGFTSKGGNSFFGYGGASIAANSANQTGTAGSLYGGGGGGGMSFNAGGTQAGAAGAKGVVYITEYV